MMRREATSQRNRFVIRARLLRVVGASGGTGTSPSSSSGFKREYSCVGVGVDMVKANFVLRHAVDTVDAVDAMNTMDERNLVLI